MKKESIEKWIEALRSGKYKQTTTRLKYKGAFCCLGVACDIRHGHDWASYSDCFEEYPDLLILEEYGIDELHGLEAEAYKIFKPGNQSPLNWRNLAYYLAHANDTLGWDFNQIADWIETHLLPLAKQ